MKSKTSTSSQAKDDFLEFMASLPDGQLSFVLQKILWQEKNVPHVIRRFVHKGEERLHYDTFEQHVLITSEVELHSWLNADPRRHELPQTFHALQTACRRILLDQK